MRTLVLALSTGGLGRYGVCLGKALSELLDVRIIAHPELLQNDIIRRYLKTVDVESFDQADDLRSPTGCTAVSGLLRTIDRFRPDLVHDTAGSSLRRLLWARHAIHARWPVVVTEHDPIPHTGMESLRTTVSRFLTYRTVDWFTVHGTYCRQGLVAAGVNSDRITVHPHGPLDLFLLGSHESVKREPKNVLFFGELRQNKGVEQLPLIWRRVMARHSDALLVVAGNPRSGLTAKMKRMGWESRISSVLQELRDIGNVEIHPRFILDDEIAFFFSRASAVLLPYLDATQSGVSALAGTFGCATVATDVGDLRESIIHETSGLLVPPGDFLSLADRVSSLIADPAESSRLGLNARLLYQEGPLSWRAIARKIVAGYDSMMFRQSKKK